MVTERPHHIESIVKIKLIPAQNQRSKQQFGTCSYHSRQITDLMRLPTTVMQISNALYVWCVWVSTAQHPPSLNHNLFVVVRLCFCQSLVFPLLFRGIECVAVFETVQALENFSSTHIFPLVIWKLILCKCSIFVLFLCIYVLNWNI